MTVITTTSVSWHIEAVVLLLFAYTFRIGSHKHWVIAAGVSCGALQHTKDWSIVMIQPVASVLCCITAKWTTKAIVCSNMNESVHCLLITSILIHTLHPLNWTALMRAQLRCQKPFSPFQSILNSTCMNMDYHTDIHLPRGFWSLTLKLNLPPKKLGLWKNVLAREKCGASSSQFQNIQPEQVKTFHIN